MLKRLLILSEPLLPPAFSPRLTSLIDYLTQNGWQCTLETEPPFAHRVLDHLFRCREKRFTQRLKKTYSARDFDAVFCSTYYYFPLLTAQKLSQAWHLPLFIDVRDIAEQWGKTNYFTSPLPKLFGIENLFRRIYIRRNIRLRNHALRCATAVTTVSPWHQQFLQSLTQAPVSLIYNGYNEAELQPEDCPTDSFRLAFIGRFINLQLRRPDLLFQAVSELDIPIQLDFYSEPHLSNNLRRLAERYNITDKLHLYDYIPRAEIQPTMSQASILLAFGAPASEQQHGILGTKVFEAIGMEKPFMLIPSDEGDLAQLIADTGIGIAARTTDDIKSFVLNIYKDWQTNGFTRQPVRDKHLFTRRYQAQQFEELINDKLPNDKMVSVIVPVYNAEPYLAQCLCSLTNQTYRNIEILLVDDGSTDGSRRIAEAFVEADKRVKLFTQPNKGQSAARNTALQHATGDYICFVDADDWLDKDFLSTMLSHIGDFDVLQTGYKRVKDDMVVEQKCPQNFYQFTAPWARLYSRENIRKVGLFPLNMIYEDVIFSLQLWSLKPSYRLINYTGYNYRMTSDSITSRVNVAAQHKLYDTIRRTYAPLWLKLYTILRLKCHFRK